MNRVVLAGRLAGRPKLLYTPTGVAVAHFRLFEPRGGRAPLNEDAFDAVDAVAFREAALELVSFGDLDYRITCEGRLRREVYVLPNGLQTEGLRVHCDCADFVDPVARGLPTDPRLAPNVPLPVPIRTGRAGRV